ncbi:MAG: T9SS type A sorting domain-containing protein [Gemmatimonadaceae bacterium]|nr:T9SS type A sorting domain-containing protein [Gemmatimonadaceae bacterium]
MKTAILFIIGLAVPWSSAGAEPRVEGRVLLPSGAPVAGAQVLLLDLTDLREAPLAAITDRSGRFTLPLAAPAETLPARFQLGSNYPNPFNPSTLIPYQLPAPMAVRLEVFNVLGQRVATLVDGEQPAGAHTAEWDATDAAGQAVGAGVYICRLSGGGAEITRPMLLIDGQAGIPSGAGSAGEAPAAEAGAPAYGLIVSGPGRVPYVDPAFRVEAGMAPLDVMVEGPGDIPSAKVATGGILGDVDNTGHVDFFDALLVVAYSLDPSIVMPNGGDISLGDVNADGRIDLSDAWTIAAYLNDPSDPTLPAIGEAAGPAVSLSPDSPTLSFADDGAWHRFTVEAEEPVTVVVNPAGTPRLLEITTRSGRGNYCPAEAEDTGSRQDGQAVYLAGCGEGQGTVELRSEADGTVLRTYTFEVSGSPADLVVQSILVSDNNLTPGQTFTLSATIRNQGTGESAATVLRYYRSSNRTISTADTQVGTDQVSALAASGASAESILLEAPSAEGTYYYGACVDRSDGESASNNCSAGVRVTVEAANQAPVATVSALPPQSLRPGQSVDVDVDAYFSDPDGEALTYSASSANEGIAMVSVAGHTVTFTGVAEGTTTVMVTASDPGGRVSTPLSASVTVTADAADEYTPVDWIHVVAGGGIQAQVGVLTIAVAPGGGCLTVSNVVSDSVTSFGTSKWQILGEDAEWTDVSGTERDGDICGSLLPDTPGEFRWVVEITTDGVTGKYASGNTLVVSG